METKNNKKLTEISLSNQRKNIKYEDFDQGIKAAYRIGILDGRSDMQNQMEEIRIQLTNMLETNKHLFQLAELEHVEDKAIKISPCFTRTLLRILKEMDNPSPYKQLREKYEITTGIKYRVKRKYIKKGER